MFIKLVFVANLFAVALGQTVTCLSAGDNPITHCSQFINTFCGAIDTENLRLNDSNSRCYNFDANNRCDFEAYNSHADNTSPSGANCITVLEAVASQCNFGGQGQINTLGYAFSVDFNDGPCTPRIALN